MTCACLRMLLAYVDEAYAKLEMDEVTCVGAF
jgi:hypothetical protein